ncbi:hypothetical protein EPUS_07824 [Endocarpon pusillum Z07020]|uniref:Nucleolar 27S pre-rRNA processing Urb2/Npa2 C-terminal domain-containing protein n=1 Tax=Endocarpon pusillum (strain Z07020 / HMAS-L-300199) TaxID=1263415 RepID=U1GNU3_ENDPU|nr:uncharacterized protein EPUS_07824 [Endocarpon pusillum Z07020]ERF73973.1 hypothetical protein EPUS_07824 [Endocarpon pusillum Z07020]
MSSSTEQSAHRALLSLERSTAPPSELLDEAARILGVNFENIKGELFSEPVDCAARNSILFAAREEWALRWLFKKTKPGASTKSLESKPDSSANNNPRKWLLFFYLVQKVPVKKIAKTLRDQDAVQQVQDVLEHLVDSPKPSTPTTASPRVQSPTSRKSDDDDYALPQAGTRKRKRPPGLEESVGEDSTLQIVLSVLRALKICLDNASATEGEDAVAQQHMRIALSLSPERAGIILEYILLLVHDVLSTATPSFDSHLLHHFLAALRLWDLRRGPDLGHTNEECNQIFTARCLLPGLSLLKSLRNMEVRDHHKDIETWLEGHIVQHTVEPTRKVFFDELTVNWKANEDPISPEHIQPVIGQLQNLLFPSTILEAQSDAAKCHPISLPSTAPILLELAVRSCPKSTVRKAQHEQPWLEALLVCLSYAGGRSLVDNVKVVQTTEEAGPEPCSHTDFHSTPKSLVCLKGLLSTAIQWKVSLSLSLLGAFAQQFARLQEHESADWAVVEKIMQLDVNVFLPNSGMTSAKMLLDSLIDALNFHSSYRYYPSESALDSHTFVRIVSLLMEGFASARDLGTFVNIWMDRLAEAETARDVNQKNGQSVKPYSLWEDEDVMAEFSKVAKRYVTPTFIEAHLEATVQPFRDKTYAGKHYGLVFVLDILLTTHKEEFEAATDTLKVLCLELRDAVQSLKGFGRMIGFLWRLLRHSLPFVGTELPFLNFLDVVMDKEQSIVKTALQNADEKSVTYLTSISHFNEVERFHCFIEAVALHRSHVSAQLVLEIRSLTYHVERLEHVAITNENTPLLWDGRITSLECKHDLLLTAFLCILIQRSRVLCLDTETTISLLKGLALHVAGDVRGDQSPQSGFAVLLEGILLDEALVSTPGFVKKCIKTIGFTGDCGGNFRKMAIIQALPREAMSKAQRKQIAEWQREMGAASKKKTVDVTVLERDTAKSHISPQGTSNAETSYGDLQRSCRNAIEEAASKCSEDILGLCESLRKESSSRTNLLLVGSMLHKGGPISPYTTALAVDLSTLLPTTTSLETFCLTADCLKLILDKHHPAVNQWTIDSLLAHIAIITSSQGPILPNTAAPIIFERLCRLLGVVLGRYRIRLGGRYHLLLPALYGLLHCLFAADPTSLATPSQL